MTKDIRAITMPKWGLAMTEGELTAWLVDEGAFVDEKFEIAEIETTKITNVFESPISGKVRKLVAHTGEVLPIGALLAVIAADEISDDEIDNYVSKFQEDFVPEEDGASDDPVHQKITVGDHQISYLKIGDGNNDPVLLIHGFGADTVSWMFNQSVLADGRAVYAIDLPGHGRSSKSIPDGSIASMAKIVSGLISALGLKNVHLIGHSFGGALAIAAAEESGAKSITVIGSCGLGKEINTKFLQGFIDGKRGKHLKPVLEQLVFDKSLIGGDMINEVIKFKRIDGVPAALQALVDSNFANGLQSTDLRGILSKLLIPVSVIWGANDEIISVSHSQGLGSNVSVSIIENSGHIPQMEKSSEVNDIILKSIGN